MPRRDRQPLGHERLPRWYAELSEAEHYTWKQATRAVGPPRWGNGRTRQDLADAFLRRLEFLLPKGARMLRKLDTARYPSGKQEARRKGERAEDAARAGAHGLVELGRGRRSRPAAAVAGDEPGDGIRGGPAALARKARVGRRIEVGEARRGKTKPPTGSIARSRSRTSMSRGAGARKPMGPNHGSRRRAARRSRKTVARRTASDGENRRWAVTITAESRTAA